MFIFVKIVNHYIMFRSNISKIATALETGKITKDQARDLYFNNYKWNKICSHKGLIDISADRIFFIPRTSYYKSINLPKTVNEIKAIDFNNNLTVLNEKKIQFIKFNEFCNIGNKKWVLGYNQDGIVVQDFENRLDIIAKLIGSQEDLIKFKSWVKIQNLEEFDISPFLKLDQMIEELHAFNFNNVIKDE